MRLLGQVLDKNKKPLSGATVYVSRSNGKPKGANSATTDDKGRWFLDGVESSDSITARLVGFKQTTVPVKKATKIPNPVTGAKQDALVITMPDAAAQKLPEVEVKPSAPTTEQALAPVEEKKEGMSNATKIALVAGGVILLSGLVYFITRKKK